MRPVAIFDDHSAPGKHLHILITNVEDYVHKIRDSQWLIWGGGNTSLLLSDKILGT